MSAQTITKVVGQVIALQGIFTKDANGNAISGVTYSLNVLSGPAGGITPNFGGVVNGIVCNTPGTYTITITGTCPGGSITTDAAGDITAVDTIIVVAPPPESQGWVYV